MGRKRKVVLGHKNGMRKLKTRNRIVAVLRAVRFGLIEVQP